MQNSKEMKLFGETEDIENMQVKWEEIDISNDFLFGKIMRDPDICKELLQIILPELEIGYIEYPMLQKQIDEDTDARSVRLDIYAHDNKGIVYNIEMQVIKNKNLPQRSRYYQSMIDLQLLNKGDLYSKLNQSYVIFICPFDFYNKGRHIYTFENICTEDKSVSLGDKTTKIFLNANGVMDDVSENLKAFLDYVAGKESENDFVKRLKEAVSKAKRNREWRHEYMSLLIRDQENIELGIEKGVELGIEKGKKLGIELGIEKGIKEMLVKMIKNMDISKVSEITGISIEEIRNMVQGDE